MRNFIWDFDGTLFDSYPHIAKAFCMMLDNNNREYIQQEVMEALQVSFRNAYVKYSLSKDEIDEFKSYASQVELQPEIIPFENAKEVLEYVAEHGGVNYIYTHRDKQSLELYLKKYEVYTLFEECVTPNSGFDFKPSPQAIEYIVNKYELDKDDTIMIGDREIDVLSGINAGIHGGLLTTKKDSTEADYVFEDLLDIKKLII